MNIRQAAALLPLLGCSEPAAPVDASFDAALYEASIAAHHTINGYQPFGADAGVEMRLGFQGFRYTRVVLVASRGVPEHTPGRARLDIDGFDRAEQRFAALAFREFSPGVFVSTPLMVFANDVNLARAVGRRATLTVDLEDRCCRATATFEGPVRFDPDCVEDAQFRCQPAARPDGGGL